MNGGQAEPVIERTFEPCVGLVTAAARGACGDRAPWQNVVVLWQSGGSWLLGLLHATLLRRSITVDERLVAPGRTGFDLPLVDEAVGDMIRIPGGARVEAINTSTRKYLVVSCAGGLALSR